MTPEGLFEPTVIVFGLTNSLATFQTMINEILKNLINTRKLASFIDDIIVETEEEVVYNKVVEEVVKKLIENDLYMKLEKCKWKVSVRITNSRLKVYFIFIFIFIFISIYFLF